MSLERALQCDVIFVALSTPFPCPHVREHSPRVGVGSALVSYDSELCLSVAIHLSSRGICRISACQWPCTCSRVRLTMLAGVLLCPQAAAEASAAQPSGEEADRQARAVARLRSDLQRKESLLRASQAQLDEVGGGELITGPVSRCY